MGETTSQRTFCLPDLGEGLTECVVMHWLVAEGDAVQVDQAVVEVETAKSVVEVPSPYVGVVAQLHAAAGQELPVGSPLFTVTTDQVAGGGNVEPKNETSPIDPGNVLVGYGPSVKPRGRRRPPAESLTDAGEPPANDTSTQSNATEVSHGPVPVSSPSVRRLARERGIDLRTVNPTGPNGRITRSDVERSLQRNAHSQPIATIQADPERRREDRHVPLNSFRRTVIAKLSQSRREIPEATVWVDVDATALWNLREATREADKPGPSLLAYIARFVVAGLKAYPALNARLDLERHEIVEHAAVNLGVATQGERGLTVPTVYAADKLTTRELSVAIHEAVERAQGGNVGLEEMAAATFTLNNYGRFRVDGSAAIINYPQVAIVGFGRIIDRPWVVAGQLKVRKVTVMSLAFDHRVCDGGTASGFMRAIADAIENPASVIATL